MDNKTSQPRNDQLSLESTPEARLSSPRNVLNILPQVEIRPLNGRVIGTKSPHIPPMIKRIIGEGAHMADGLDKNSTKAVAEAFDVGTDTVTRAKRDTGEAKRELDKEIHDKAIESIVGMFETSVAAHKLASLETKDATRAMKDLAKVAEVFGEKKGNVFNGPTLVIFAPSAHTEDNYDVIDVEAREVK